jgi:shikimate dehydrogenase
MTDKVLGIFGHPVGHSLSPAMHNHAAKLLGLDYTYVAFDVPPESLLRAIKSIRTLGIAGVNVTVPHKEKAARLVDKLEGDAAVVRAANTITLRDGMLIGTNTDGVGFINSLKRGKINPAGKKAAIIGAGGSSCSIGLSLLRAGVSGLTVINRSPAGGKKLARLLSPFGKINFVPASSPSAGEAAADADIVVQTTPVGMRRSDPLPLARPRFRKGQLVYDIIYAPEKTKLLKLAEKQGARTMNGLSMLVYQGSESFNTWTGHRFPDEKVLGMLNKLLKERSNG